MSTVQIYNPNAEFGFLSPYTLEPFFIEHKPYKNIIGFIYSQFMCENSYVTILSNIDPKNMYSTFIELYNECHQKEALNALKKAYELYLQNRIIRREFVNISENNKLRFEDQYNLLSNKYKTEFENFLEKLAGSYRQEYLQEEIGTIKREMDDIIYKKLSYYFKLETVIITGINDLSAFINKNADETTDSILRDINGKNRQLLIETFLNEKGKGPLNDIFSISEKSFAGELRKKYLNSYKSARDWKNINKLFTLFSIYVMMTEYDIDSQEKSLSYLEKIQSSLSSGKREKFLYKITKLRDQNKLPAILMKQYKKIKLDLPTDYAIKKAKKFISTPAQNKRYHELSIILTELQNNDKSNFYKEKAFKIFNEKVEQIKADFASKKEQVINSFSKKDDSFSKISLDKELLRLNYKESDEIDKALKIRDISIRGPIKNDIYIENIPLLSPFNQNIPSYVKKPDGKLVEENHIGLAISSNGGFPTIYSYVAYLLFTTEISYKYSKMVGDIISQDENREELLKMSRDVSRYAYRSIFSTNIPLDEDGNIDQASKMNPKYISSPDYLFNTELPARRDFDVQRICYAATAKGYGHLLSPLNKNFVETLLATGDKYISFADKNDPFLGIGPDGNGFNIIGQHLMKLRQSFSGNKITSNPYINKQRKESSSRVFDYFGNGSKDEKIWITDKIDDILLTSSLINLYNSGTSFIVNDKVIQFITKTLYRNCTPIDTVVNQKSKYSQEFAKYVEKSMKNFNIMNESDVQVNISGLQSIWNFVNTSIKFIREQAVENGISTEDYIKTSKQELLHSDVETPNSLTTDYFYNIYILGLVNVLSSIKVLYNNKTVLDTHKILAVCNILVKQNFAISDLPKNKNKSDFNSITKNILKTVLKNVSDEVLNIIYRFYLLLKKKSSDDIIRRIKFFAMQYSYDEPSLVEVQKKSEPSLV